MQNDQGATRTVGRYISLSVDWFEVAALAISTALLAILLIANVIARTFFQAIYFAEELSEFLIIFTTFVGVSYAARKARHIRMGAFLDSMPPKVEKIFIYVISSINAIVMFLMTYHSWNYMINAKTMNQTTQALRMPYWITLVIVPIGFASAGIQYVRTVIKNIHEEDVWQSPEQQSEYEDEIGGY
jgi:TRAP-type C4-dicarboxylate transport system permease small subunit